MASAGRNGAVLGHDLGHREVDRARDVAGGVVDRLGLAAVALRGADVEEDAGARHRGGALGVEDGDRTRTDGERPRVGRGDLGGHRPARALPRGEPTVEDADLRVARPAQHPPRAGRPEGGLLVVDDDLGVVVEAGPRGGRPRGRRGRGGGGGRARPGGPARAVSRSRKGAPGRWAAA